MTNRTILLVEDNPKDEMLTRRALSKANISNPIITAHDGEEALNILFGDEEEMSHEHFQSFAVVLLDLRLPKIDGHEVLRRIRADERTNHLPVVILSSSDDRIDVEKGYNAGVNSYVQKPVNINDFMAAVENLGLYWLITNIPPYDDDHGERKG